MEWLPRLARHALLFGLVLGWAGPLDALRDTDDTDRDELADVLLSAPAREAPFAVPAGGDRRTDEVARDHHLPLSVSGVLHRFRAEHQRRWARLLSPRPDAPPEPA